ncbi:MAG: SDR family oxidoreductase [Candidimonas sp.]|nr:SDR family oxidoreductase [Candidimonas sp.]
MHDDRASARCQVMLTGATGFIGRELSRSISLAGHKVIEACRRPGGPASAAHRIVLGDFGQATDWSAALRDVEVVIHCAGLAHVAREAPDPELAYMRANVQVTRCLAQQAVAAGVKRFIFISSIGVNGNCSAGPFTESDAPDPRGPYARSKWLAECALWELRQHSRMELVIIRPPLVYGPGAPGNFATMQRWVGKGVPLPLGAVHNRRSLVGIDNLCDMIIHCLDHPGAADQVLLVSDGHDVSTTELLRRLGEAMGRPARLIPCPVSMLRPCALLLGQRALAQRLLGSLQVDISHTCQLLDWAPPYSLDEGLKRCFGRGGKFSR